MLKTVRDAYPTELPADSMQNSLIKYNETHTAFGIFAPYAQVLQ
jgi:hypothetical protein